MGSSLFIPWTEIEFAVTSLSKQMSSAHYDAVICVASGGLVLGKLFSEALDLPLGIIVSKRYGNEQFANGEEYIDVEIKWCTTSFKPKKILLVDDLIDKGETMHKILAGIHKKNKQLAPTNIDICVLYYKEKHVKEDFSKYKVWYYNTTDDWLVFPWEKEFRRTKLH